jgi:hypothetical protein
MNCFTQNGLCGSGSSFPFDADLDPDFFTYADPDSVFYLMLMRIKVTKMMRIHQDPDADRQHSFEG